MVPRSGLRHVHPLVRRSARPASSSPTPSRAPTRPTPSASSTDLPKTFNPRKFYPQDWAALAKLAGIKYVVFTTKHHAGFTMWDTKTNDYGIMHTPFKRDLTREILDAFRAQGIAPGHLLLPRRLLVAVEAQNRHPARHPRRAAARQPGPHASSTTLRSVN
ncbi:MAG: alpha-L-fucosidase [Paludibaculum sp.]